MIDILATIKPSWPAPPVIKKPKPDEKPKPASFHLAPQHQLTSSDFCSPYDTPFVSPMDIMMYPDAYRLTTAQAQEFIDRQQPDKWMRCMEVM